MEREGVGEMVGVGEVVGVGGEGGDGNGWAHLKVPPKEREGVGGVVGVGAEGGEGEGGADLNVPRNDGQRVLRPLVNCLFLLSEEYCAHRIVRLIVCVRVVPVASTYLHQNLALLSPITTRAFRPNHTRVGPSSMVYVQWSFSDVSVSTLHVEGMRVSSSFFTAPCVRTRLGSV